MFYRSHFVDIFTNCGSRLCAFFNLMLLVSESQALMSSNERTMNKSASQPFIGGNQPHNRLAWNSDLSGQTKAKQDEVSVVKLTPRENLVSGVDPQIQKTISSRVEVNLKLEQDDMEGVDEKEWDE